VTAAAELAEHDERIARRVAQLVALEIAPGSTSALLPDWLIERMREWQPFRTRSGPLYAYGPDYVDIECAIGMGGGQPTMTLEISANGRTAWRAVLRGPDAAP
jgi:hypothetical protein